MARARQARPGADRAWRLGMAAGALAGIGVVYLNRRVQQAARGGLVDWPRAEQIAAARLGRMAGALDRAELSAAAASYAEAMRRIVPALEAQLGAPLPGVVERHAAVTRAEWASANLVAFRQIYAHIEAAFGDRLRPHEGDLGEGLAALANRALATQQIAFVLSYLGTRVLGQYDVALLSAETHPGQLLFVEENIRATAASLAVPVDDFRIWVALHETTHAFEFEAHPWLRPYLAERMERQLAGLLEGAQVPRLRELGGFVRRWRARDGAGLLEGLLNPEQRRLFDETQTVMSLLEGFSDWVMDRVGATFLPDVRLLRERFEARRSQPRRGRDALVARLMGMDLKLAQYRRGERFVSGVAAAGGVAAVARLWDGPESLPTQDELGHPEAWVSRVVGRKMPT
ncbi:MAG: zinc-dependent metalloprotease [Candidatus Limnocylindrales bacterium]